MEKLKQMKEALVGCVETQIYGNLKDVDAKELGEAVDMIKDLAEAIYYCTITEAMNEGSEHGEKSGKGQHGTMYYKDTMMPMYRHPEPIEYYDPRYNMRYPAMYETGNGRETVGTQHAAAMRGYRDGMVIYPYEGHEQNGEMHDPKDGHSWRRRKMYMEGKGMKDKTHQMKELDAYVQELSQDLVEMVQDASPEEKQLLQQKISTLASKIK